MDRINSNGGISRATGTGSPAYPVIGWLAALLSLVCLPYVFGVIGMIMGILTNKSGSKAAMLLIVASIILMTVGLIFSGMLFNFIGNTLGI